jgi:hypothetical protein
MTSFEGTELAVIIDGSPPVYLDRDHESEV